MGVTCSSHWHGCRDFIFKTVSSNSSLSVLNDFFKLWNRATEMYSNSAQWFFFIHIQNKPSYKQVLAFPSVLPQASLVCASLCAAQRTQPPGCWKDKNSFLYECRKSNQVCLWLLNTSTFSTHLLILLTSSNSALIPWTRSLWGFFGHCPPSVARPFSWSEHSREECFRWGKETDVPSLSVKTEGFA